MNTRIELPSERIIEFCERWCIASLALFGSVLREDFCSDSDVDVRAEFGGAARHALFDMDRMEEELGTLLGRPVDLVERADVERSKNYIRRKAVLESVETIYAA